MDTPVTRSKQQMIDFYVGNLDEFFGFNGEQCHAVRTAMVLLYGEVEEKLQSSFKQDACRVIALDAEVLRLHTDLNNLRDEHSAQAREMNRICTELQALKVEKDATIHTNGTAPSQERAAPAAPAAPAAEPRRRVIKPRGPYKKKGATADEIARQLEGEVVRDAPTVGHIDRNLISDDPNDISLTGKLRREESVVTTHHGIPVKVTRQFVELR